MNAIAHMDWSYWMTRVDLVAAWLVALVWLIHLVQAAVGMRELGDLGHAEFDNTPDPAPKVSIVVPARNEAHTIEPALRSLRNLEYPSYEIIAVNDRSTDETGPVMRRIAKESGGAAVQVLDISELPDGWLGKTHAMWRGAQQGTGDWILFTDADVVFRPDSVRRAMAYAVKTEADHVVLFPTMVTLSAGERMMLATFQALIGFGHRPWKVADPDSRDYVGVGAFNLVRRPVYEKLGTYAAMKLAVVDDMELGRRVKQHRFRQRVVFGRDLVRIHWATGALGIVHNLSKNFFAYVRFSVALAFGAVLGLLLLNVLPFAGLLLASGWTSAGCAVAVLCIFAAYLGMSPKSGIPPGYIVTHPISSILLAYGIVLSTFSTLRRGGVLWRGTVYPLDELRGALD